MEGKGERGDELLCEGGLHFGEEGVARRVRAPDDVCEEGPIQEPRVAFKVEWAKVEGCRNEFPELTVDGVQAAGKPVPIEREGRPFSTCCLAFSESWTEKK